MTPLPKKKHTRGRSGRRRGGQPQLSIPNLYKCPNCGKPKESHKACRSCGYYSGDTSEK